MYGDYQKREHRHVDSLFRYAEMLGFGEIHFKIDHATELHSIIAIHNTKRGPAIGGCRLIHYDHIDEALVDAMRLARMMSYKAAVCKLPHGGAKAVIMRPKLIKDRQAFFEAFGDFVEEQQGRYVTALDSGTEPADMDIIAKHTRYVTCTTFGGYAGDPAPYTALGIRRGMEAAVKFKLGRNNLEGIRVAIQGAGHVAYYLTKELTKLGAHITICDVNKEAIQHIVNEFGANITVVQPDQIFDVPCDIFAPCALGAILNLTTIRKLKASIVAGSANNQLDHRHHDIALHQRGILYVPDFVINSGGLIHVAAIYDHGDEDKASAQIYDLYNTLMELFERAKKEHRPTNEIAELTAEENLQ
jgi:leucine dehydrogenase